MDAEEAAPMNKLNYPKSVAFIISNEFCERFNYYGMRAILVLYMTRQLSYSTDEATVLFHVFTGLVYFFPLFGAIVADAWLGRFATILYLSIVYASGSVIISLGAIPNMPLRADIATMVGLLLIAIGTGGIKPCVSAFGGDQFRIPEQAKQLATFFSLFYMSINAGSLVSMVITPILREDVNCFGDKSCYSLAFGAPAVLMVLAIIIYVLGKPFYTIKKPSGNMLVSVCRCIGNALSTRSRERNTNPRLHWLDYAVPEYGETLVYDVKCLLKVIVICVPLPLFWALYDQQGSSWTFQATRMDSHASTLFSIKPDQMQVIGPFLIIFCVPLFNLVIYPLLAKINIRTPLQKMAIGMVLCGLSFAITGLVELELERTYPVIPRSGEGQLRIFNGQTCAYKIQTNIPLHHNISIEPMGIWEEKHLALLANSSMRYTYDATSDSPNCLSDINGEFEISSGKAHSYLISGDGQFVAYDENPDKPKQGQPLVRILPGMASAARQNAPTFGKVTLTHSDSESKIELVPNNTQLNEILSGQYVIGVDNETAGTIELREGGTYTVLIAQSPNGQYQTKAHAIAQPNTVNILWQIPQYFIITAGEIMFSITGLEFSFTQAPSSMKSVMAALWLLTNTFGNFIVVIIAEIRIFDSPAKNFFFYTTLMAVDTLIFIFLAVRYTYRIVSEPVEDADSGLPTTEKIGADGNMAEPAGANKKPTLSINELNEWMKWRKCLLDIGWYVFCSSKFRIFNKIFLFIRRGLFIGQNLFIAK